MISDDLTSLLQPRAGEPPFRQGTIITFDPSDGSNTVSVGGATLTNVPLLNIGDTVNISPGDVVVLMKLRSAWAILGRVIVPGGSSLSVGVVATETQSAFATNFAVTTSDVAVATTPLFTVPPWANKLDVTVSAYCSGRNSTALDGNFYVRAYAGGDLGTELFVPAPATTVVALSIGNVASAAGSLGGNTFTCSAVVSTDASTGNWATSTSNRALVAATAIYTRTP